MLIPRNRGYKRRYVYGGAGLFDSIAKIFTGLFNTNTAKQIASAAVDAGKSIAKEGAKKAVEIGKNAALDMGKKIVKKALTSRAPADVTLTPKSQAILKKYVGAQNVNALIDGSGMQQNRTAIAIQDLVRKLNGNAFH